MPKKIIGVTGAIGSGKSTVGNLLSKHGGYVIDADSLAKEALSIGKTPYHQTVELFSDSILMEDGNIDRNKLRKTIIDYPIMKAKLEGIVHPFVIDAIISILNKPIVAKFFVIDAPLLFESNLDKMCDYVMFVDVNPQLRYIRLRNRNTMALNEARSLEESILSNDYKKEHSSFVLDNSKSIEFLHDQLIDILSKLAL